MHHPRQCLEEVDVGEVDVCRVPAAVEHFVDLQARAASEGGGMSARGVQARQEELFSSKRLGGANEGVRRCVATPV